MKPVEIRRQVFRADAHWNRGLSYRLRRLESGGLALFSRPAFDGWVTRDASASGAASFALDDCGRLFWIHAASGRLYRRDPVNGLVEAMVALAGDGAAEPHEFGRMLVAAGRLWVLDRTRSMLLAMRPDTFQVVTTIALVEAIDVAIDSGRVFTLDAAGIAIWDLDGRLLAGPRNEKLTKAVTLGAGPNLDERWIYVVDQGATGFLRYSAKDALFEGQIGDFNEAGAGFRPELLVVDGEGNLFVSDRTPSMHEFSSDGGYIGSTSDLDALSGITGVAVDPSGELYVASPEGVAHLSRASGVAGNDGVYYTRTLDNGLDHLEGWHRVDLSAELDAGGALDVWYATTNDAALTRVVESVLDGDATSAEKARSLETILGDAWKGPHELRGVEPPGAATAAAGGFARNLSHSVLFAGGTGRYLWLKLRLLGLAPEASASVREMRVYYPRLSYLRYLPAVYQQDPVSAEFLARFLSMFETVFMGLEATIERIPETFDPDLAPDDFLDWLAQWLDLGIEEDWPADVKRELIRKASRLYQRKGTPAGLAEFIQIITKSRAVIRESFETDQPFILGEGTHLGVGTRVFRRPTTAVPPDQRAVLGRGSILGTSHIRSSSQLPANPFRSAAHRFTLLLDLSHKKFQQYQRGLHRIISDNTPAHVDYDIRLVPGGSIGANAVLGVNVAVSNPRPFHLGYSALGHSRCVSRMRFGPELGIDSTLAGSA